MKNIAYFASDTHPVDLQRHIRLAKATGFDVVSDLSLAEIKDSTGAANLLLTGGCELGKLFQIKWWLIRGKLNTIRVIILELYHISYAAWYEELKFQLRAGNFRTSLKSILYFGSCMPIRIFLLRLILSSSMPEVIVPSSLRIDYLKKVFQRNVSFVLLRNMPVLSDFNLIEPKEFEQLSTEAKELVGSGIFFFVAGRINVEVEFFRVCAYAFKNQIRIIVATGQTEILNRAIRKFPGLIVDIGHINNDLVVFISSRCLSGICLYHNSTSNQRLSASSKLFEFMLMSKPIITSENLGIKSEIDFHNRHLVISLQDLESGMSIPKNEVTLNALYSFENELSRIVN